MKTYIVCLIILLISCFSESTKVESLTTYYWIPKSNTIAIINVPPNYEVEHHFYGEGVITNLMYSDSSLIFLHFGGVLSLPFCKKPDCIEMNKRQLGDRLYRSGIHINSNLHWREENNVISALINIGFSRVRESKLDVFNKSLDSFILNEKYH